MPPKRSQVFRDGGERILAHPARSEERIDARALTISQASVARMVLAAAMLAALSTRAVAQAGGSRWVSIGPEGGMVLALAVDPRSPSTIYAGCNGDVFKSVNGGSSWAPTGLGGPKVLALVLDPTRPLTLYAGTNKGIFKSTDGGSTWTPASTGLPPSGIPALAVDPQTPATVYAGTNSGVFKSTDGAASWTTASTGIGVETVSALAIDPASPSTLYAGTQNAGVFRSSDGAVSWTAARSGLTPTLIHCLAVDPKSRSTIYAGTNAGLFKSTDGAASWSAVGGQASNFFAVAIDPQTPSTVYGGTGGQVLKSVNGVGAWQRASAGLPVQIVWALALDPVTPSNLYAGTQSGIFKSSNGGVSCAAASSGITPLKAFALAFDPAAPSTVYVGGNEGLFKSADGGKSWTLMINGLPPVPVLSLDVITGSSAVLAGTAAGTDTSTDGGANWTQTFGLDTFAFATDPKSPMTIYAAGGAGPNNTNLTGGAGKSVDGGLTWNPYGGSNTPLPIFNAIAVGSGSSLNVIVGTDSGIYANLVHGGGGVEWVTNGALASRPVFAVAFAPGSASTVYAGTDNGLYKSTNSGTSWAQVTNGLTATGIYALLFDPASSSTVYAGTNAGVFVSTDNGASWRTLNAGLTNPVVNAIVRAPGPGGALYAATNGGGVFEYESVPCMSGPTTLCLNGGRFEVSTRWTTRDGQSGPGQAVALTGDTGYFTFFDPGNVELVVKVVNGCSFNSKFWTFAGGLTDVNVVLTVTDSQTGSVKTYTNPQGTPFQPIQDTNAFACGLTGTLAAAARVEAPPLPGGEGRGEGRIRVADGILAAAACVPDATTLCLNNSRYKVQAQWSTRDGASGSGQVIPLTGDTGAFWFFSSNNVEMVIKVLNGCGLNSRYWTFAGGLTDVNVLLTVTDTQTGTVKTYTNPQGTPFQPIQDTSAFGTCP